MSKLRNKIAISFAVLAILLSGVIVLSLYSYVSVQVRESTRIRLMDIANTASLLLDVDQHAMLTEAEQMDSTEFLDLRRELDTLLLKNPNILYAYTMRSVEDEVIFVVDSIIGEGEPADLGEVYDEADQSLSDYAAAANTPWADEDFTTDEWGTVLSGYAPLYTSEGELDGIIGVDMDVEDVRNYESQFFWVSLIIFLLSAPLVIAVGWLIGGRLATPLISLTNDVKKIAAGDLSHRAQITSNDEIAQLANSFNHMTAQVQFLIHDLEERVAQRTHDLEIRNQHLEATTQIGQAAAAILDTDELIQEVVEQIQQRFGLYYVGLFLADANKDWAILRAGTGAAGQAMVSRKHRIQIGSGMIGWSILKGQPRIAQMAEEDIIRLATTELPDTRAEAALPLRSRNQVLGAISVQSDQPNAFDEQTIRVLQTMADQVAIALDNAMLFMKNQAALELERRAAGRVGREGWKKLHAERPDLGYRVIGNEIQPVHDEWDHEMILAAQQNKPIQDEQGNLSMPIQIREQVIGVLRFHKDGQDGSSQENTGLVWTNEEIGTLETVIAQVGQAIESARLYQETQRRAERERLTGEITAKVRSSNSPEVIMQTAVQELRRALQASKAQVLLKSAHTANGDKSNHIQETESSRETESKTAAMKEPE